MLAAEQELLPSDQRHRIHATAHRATTDSQHVWIDHSGGRIDMAERVSCNVWMSYSACKPVVNAWRNVCGVVAFGTS